MTPETTRTICAVVGLLLILLALPDLWRSDTAIPSFSTVVYVWIGVLLLKRSVLFSTQQPTVVVGKSTLATPKRLKRRTSSSSCPKPYTPAAPIRVVRESKRFGRKNFRPTAVKELLISESPSDVSSYNNISIITNEGSSCSTAWSPVSPQRPEVPDSIAAIWEPVDDEPTSSKLW